MNWHNQLIVDLHSRLIIALCFGHHPCAMPRRHGMFSIRCVKINRISMDYSISYSSQRQQVHTFPHVSSCYIPSISFQSVQRAVRNSRLERDDSKQHIPLKINNITTQKKWCPWSRGTPSKINQLWQLISCDYLRQNKLRRESASKT